LRLAAALDDDQNETKFFYKSLKVEPAGPVIAG
jgi:hypothetical protein